MIDELPIQNFIHNRTHFFKYVKADVALKILENIAIRWSSPLTFNDPFDFAPPAPGFTRSELEKLFAERFLELVQSDTPLNLELESHKMISKFRQLRSGVNWREELDKSNRLSVAVDGCLKAFNVDEWRELAQRTRILCLTETCENILMWAHYTDNHKGAVIKLKCIAELDTPLKVAQKVNYSNTYPYIVTAQERVNSFFNLEKLDTTSISMRWMTTKSLDWKYEQEWRCLDVVRPETDMGDYEICKIYPEEIEAVYFGCRMSEDNKERISGRLTGELKHVELYQAMQHSEKFKVVFTKIK